MLRVICPRIDLLRPLSLQLEIDAQWIARAMTNVASRHSQFCLTVDDGPSVPTFYLPAPTDTALLEVSTCPTWANFCMRDSSFTDMPIMITTPKSPSVVPAPLSGLSSLADAQHPTSINATAGANGLMSRTPFIGQSSTVARPSYVFGSTYSLMSTATLIPAGLSVEQELRRRSLVLSDPPPPIPQLANQHPLPPQPSTQPRNSLSHVIGSAARRRSSMPMDEMIVATAPNDCEARHLHRAVERISQMLVDVQDRSVWIWEDISPSRFHQATLKTLRSSLPPLPFTHPQPRKSLLLLRSTRFLDSFVCCVAEAFAEAGVDGRCDEAAACLRCHHGAPHRHNNGETEEDDDEDPYKPEGDGDSNAESHMTPLSLRPGCTVTRFAQAAFNMGITCPNRHYASRSLQIYRALEAQLDEKSLLEVLMRFVELVSDASEEVQGYMVELFLTLEAAMEHIQYRGTVLPTPASGTNAGHPSARSGSFLRSSAPESSVITSKPPQAPQSAPPFLLPSQAPPSTPPIHERRHSRRGSASSLSSLIGHSTSAAGVVAAPAPSITPMPPPVGIILPPIKRPLMPPHAEAVIEEAEVTPVAAAVSLARPVRSTPSPLTVNRPGNNTSTTALVVNEPRLSSNSTGPLIESPASGTCLLAPEEQADLLADIFWIGVCLLDSDYEYEYLAGIRLLYRLLPCVCPSNSVPVNASSAVAISSTNRKWNSQPHQSNIPDLHDHVLKLLNRLKWNTDTEEGDYPGLLGLLLKGCFSSTLIDISCRLLVHLIPAIKSPIVDPNAETRQYRRAAMSGASRTTWNNTHLEGLPSLVISLLPMLLTAWDEDPESTASTAPEPVLPLAEACETYTEATGCPAVSSSLPSPSFSSSSPPPLGSWVHRGVVISEVAVPQPSTGLLSLVTATIASGSVAKKAPQLRCRNPICVLAAENLAELAIQTDAYRFNNLAIVLRLYANGTFSKDANQLAKCVTRYLMDGYCSLGPRILAFLTAFLTLGPACVHLPLLHFVYWFLQIVDLNQPEMGSRIRNFITATSERFVNTPLWPEVTLLYQVVVARSATLTAVPSNAGTYSLPGLDPSGSGRVLDSLAAAAAAAVPLPEAEPQRIALAGRVLDFDSSVLQSAPLIAGGRGQASCRLGATLTTDHGQHRSPARTAPLVEACGLSAFCFRLGNWKTPCNRQARLRALFTNLINCFESHLDHLTAPRSPSVIFSQSTETLDRQLSMHSSSETASINGASSPDDAHFDDTSSAERAAVFHDLDTYLDAQLMNINFLDLPDGTWEDQTRCPWGVRGHSITSHAEFHEEGTDQQLQSQKPQQQLQMTHPSVSFSIDEDVILPNTTEFITAETYTIPPIVKSKVHYHQRPPEGVELDLEDVEPEDDEDDEEEEEDLEVEGGDFLSTSAPAGASAALDRQSQLSLQLSASSTASSVAGPVAVATAAPNPALLAPLAPHRTFNSQILISWNSRDDSSVECLQDVLPTTDTNKVDDSNTRLSTQQWIGTQPHTRKHTLSSQPTAVCFRRRMQDMVILGGSLDSLPTQTRGQQKAKVFKQKPSTEAKTIRRSPSSTSSSLKISTTASNGTAEIGESAVLPVKPPPRRRHSQCSLELATRESPTLPLRLSISNSSLVQNSEVGTYASIVCVTPKQLLIPTPSETAWMACQRQLKVLQKTAEGEKNTSAQTDRLCLLLTGLWSTFSGMLRRTTFHAVELANLAFCRCPPSSDLDPEICISNLVKIAQIISEILPTPFFAIHPNSIPLIEAHTVNLCMQLGTYYEEWFEAMQQLSVTCSSSESVNWKQQHEHICRDLQRVLQRLILFFRLSADLLITAHRQLVSSLFSVVDFSSTIVEALFDKFRPYLLTLPPLSPSSPNSDEVEGLETWKARCARLLLWPMLNSMPDEKVEVKPALAVYAAAMKSKAPISIGDIMVILEACCEKLWDEPNVDSGVALMFAHSQAVGVRRFEAFASVASPSSASTLFFTTDDLLEVDGQATLPPLQLADRLLRLLEA